MRKNLFYFFFIIATGRGDSQNISFDLAGHSGILITEGINLWNRSWFSGILLFDGTYASYPIRFGEHVNKNFFLNDSYNLSDFNSFKDSTFTKSYFNHARGDYNYNKLDFSFINNFKDENWKINFFKKNFYGNTGHYIINNQTNSPIQESYTINYNKKIKKQNLEFAIGRFLTKSGLPDINQNGKELNEILSSAFRIKSNFNNINAVLYFSQFFQNRRIFHSTFSDSTYHKINRSLLKFKIYKIENISLNLDNNLYLHSNDQKNYLKKWSNFYINGIYKDLNLFLGYQFFEPRKNNKNGINWNISYHYNPTNLKLLIQSRKYAEPFHPNLLNQKYIDFQFFTDNKVSLQFDNDNLTLSTSVISTMIENNIVNSPINFFNFNLNYKIFPNLSFYTKVTSQVDTSFFGIGGGEIYEVGFKPKFLFFNKKMKFESIIYANIYDGFSPYYEYSVTNNIPNKIELEGDIKNDYWLLNLEAVVNISSAKLYYKATNILNAINPNDNSSLVYRNYIYPRLGRMVEFGVEWHFDN
tara:strand:- start:844 stop:2424 length:1581 start_codon:yes stop_codon:yes gene_type:complete